MGRTARTLAALAAVTGMLSAVAGAHAGARPLDPSTRFFVPAPSQGAVRQVVDLLRAGSTRAALQLTTMAGQGHAVWFTSGSPADVERAVGKTMAQAAVERRIPVLVAYDVPFRDCGQYSAG